MEGEGWGTLSSERKRSIYLFNGYDDTAKEIRCAFSGIAMPLLQLNLHSAGGWV